jgi:pilus assembly protein CpaC
MTRRLLPFALAAVGLLLAPAAFAQRGAPPPSSDKDKDHGSAMEDMGLAIGETKSIPAQGVKNYSIGVEGIIDVRVTPDGAQFLVVGRRAGSTTLVLLKSDGSQTTWNITVSARSPDAVYRELQQLLEGTTGVRIRRVGGRFFIEGGVTTEAERNRIAQIAQLYPGQVESLVAVGSGAADRKLLIRVDFFFIEFDRSSSYTVGIGMPGSIGSDTIYQNQFTFDFIQQTMTTAQASIVNQPLPRLDIAQKRGWAKVLKQSSVITANGSEATFNSGGEANFKQFSFQGGTSGLQRIPFGTNVTVLPRYDSQTREIEIALKSEVSELTAPQQGSDLPGRSLNKLESLVNLKLGQALVLSGIRSSIQTHDVGGLPILSQIPVLGVLFGSHSDKQIEYENAIFIIPSVVETVPKSSMELMKSAISQFRDYSGDLDGTNLWDKTPPAAK